MTTTLKSSRLGWVILLWCVYWEKTLETKRQLETFFYHLHFRAVLCNRTQHFCNGPGASKSGQRSEDTFCPFSRESSATATLSGGLRSLVPVFSFLTVCYFERI